MSKRILYLPVLLFFLTTCSKKTEISFCNYPLEKPSEISEIEYEIINKVIETYYNISTKLIHLHQESSPFLSDDIDFFKFHLGLENTELSDEVLQVYKEANTSTVLLDEMHISDSVSLISRQELDCIFSKEIGGWDAYYDKYSKSEGILQFSKPGINSACNEAILEYAIYKHYLAAEWYIVVLRKINSEWVVTNRILTLIS